MPKQKREGRRVLSKKDKELLAETRYDDLLIVFPKNAWGYPRRELREIQKGLGAPALTSPEERVEQDQVLRRNREEKREGKKAYDTLLKKHEALERERDAVIRISEGPSEFTIKPAKPDESELTSVVVWSD